MILSIYDSSFSLWEKAPLFLGILLFLISSGRPSLWILSNLFLYSGSFYPVLCQARDLRCTTTFYLVVMGYDWILVTFGSVYIFHLRQNIEQKIELLLHKVYPSYGYLAYTANRYSKPITSYCQGWTVP